MEKQRQLHHPLVRIHLCGDGFAVMAQDIRAELEFVEAAMEKQ